MGRIFQKSLLGSIGLLLLLMVLEFVTGFAIPFITRDRLVFSFLMSFFETLSFLIVIFIAVRKQKPDNISKGFKLNYFIVGIIVINCMAIALYPLLERLPRYELPSMHNVFSIIYGLLLVPVLQEYFFRGIILRRLLKDYNGYAAIVLSALLFALLYFNPAAMLLYFFYGLFLGWVFAKTGSLLTCILLHAASNLESLANYPFALYDLNISQPVIIIGSLIILAVTLGVLNRIWRLRSVYGS